MISYPLDSKNSAILWLSLSGFLDRPTIAILLVLSISLYFYFLKNNKSTNIKELYAEGLDMLVSGKRQAAYNIRYIFH